MSTRVTVDDLRAAADWLDAYEAEDGDGARDPKDGPYTGADEIAARLYKVSDWLMAEAARREEEARIRQVQDMVEREKGFRPTVAQTRKVIRNQKEQ